MKELTDVAREAEIVKLRLKRNKLLLEKCPTESESKINAKERYRVRKKLFSLTKNPIYIHF